MAIVIALAFGLTGCAASVAEPVSAPAPTDEPSPTATAAPRIAPAPSVTASPILSTHEVSGVGSEERADIVEEAPGGAQSVTVDFTCAEGGPFSVEYGDSMMLGQAPLSGECGTRQQLAVPLLPRSEPYLWVTIEDGVAWEASVVYSSDPFPQDAALVEECAGFADVFSQLQNADNGYGFYAEFGSGEWYERVDAATADLVELAASARSEIAPSFTAVLGTLEERDRVPGAALEDVWDEFRTITAACDRNQSPVVIMDEFGG